MTHKSSAASWGILVIARTEHRLSMVKAVEVERGLRWYRGFAPFLPPLFLEECGGLRDHSQDVGVLCYSKQTLCNIKKFSE